MSEDKSKMGFMCYVRPEVEVMPGTLRGRAIVRFLPLLQVPSQTNFSALKVRNMGVHHYAKMFLLVVRLQVQS